MSAELYALTHRGNVGDVEFYRDKCRGARSVLELGSGTGRLLARLARPGLRLVGLERDPAFIALARRNLRVLPPSKRKAVRVVQGDMCDFELGQDFERVLIPYNSLYCLLGQRAALACFRAARRALVPGGTLSLDVWNAESFQRSPVTPLAHDADQPVVSVVHDRRTWDVYEHLSVRRARQRLVATYTYVPRGGGAVVRMPIPQRYFLNAELCALLARAGFAVEARFGDFSGGRYTARSAQLIVLARAV